MGVTDTIKAPASGTPVEEPRVRDRADVARQVRLVITFAITLALARLLRAEDRQHHRHLRPGRAGQRRRPAQGTHHHLDLVGCRGGVDGCAGAGRAEPLPAALGRTAAGTAGRHHVLPRVPDVGLRRPGRCVPGGHRQPDSRHDAHRHAAGARRPGRLPLRARRRHQHRDRGPVPRRRVLRLGLHQHRLQLAGLHPGGPVRPVRPGRRRGRRRRHRRVARPVRVALPGQPGGARCRARRPRLRPDRVPARADPGEPEGHGSTTHRSSRRSGSRSSRTSPCWARRCSTRRSWST